MAVFCGSDSIPTDEEIRERYDNFRNLIIERHGGTVSVSYRTPCEICGKYHRFGSKAQKRCNLIIVCSVVSTFKEVEDEQYKFYM